MFKYAEGILIEGLSPSGDTLIKLKKGQSLEFPDKNFPVLIDEEIILCSGKSGDNLVVDTRGYDETTATSHKIGVKVIIDMFIQKHIESETPKPHKATHQDGGADKVSIAGLSGEGADPQTPKTHANEVHSKTFIEGSEVPANETDPNVDASLKGVTLAQVQDHDPKAHALSHQDTESDEINVTGLDGELADGQKAKDGLAGTKVYYVADESKGETTKKLTFVNGILTAET